MCIPQPSRGDEKFRLVNTTVKANEDSSNVIALSSLYLDYYNVKFTPEFRQRFSEVFCMKQYLCHKEQRRIVEPGRYLQNETCGIAGESSSQYPAFLPTESRYTGKSSD
jgi:hypothetical protein